MNSTLGHLPIHSILLMILKLHALLPLDRFDENGEGSAEPVVLRYRPRELGKTTEVRVTCVSANQEKSNHL